MKYISSIADLLPKGDIETNIRKHIHEVVYHHSTTIPVYQLLPYQSVDEPMLPSPHCRFTVTPTISGLEYYLEYDYGCVVFPWHLHRYNRYPVVVRMPCNVDVIPALHQMATKSGINKVIGIRGFDLTIYNITEVILLWKTLSKDEPNAIARASRL